MRSRQALEETAELTCDDLMAMFASDRTPDLQQQIMVINGTKVSILMNLGIRLSSFHFVYVVYISQTSV